MKLSKKVMLSFAVVVASFTAIQAVAVPLELDFEDLSDLTNADELYSTYGVHFNNAISLTAGFSLNEIDYPPSSGDVAIGDDLAPIEIIFDSPTDNIYANFTYGSQLTFSAYDAYGAVIGTYIHSYLENYGSSEKIDLNFTGISLLVISGEWTGSFIMDDFGFNSTNAVPEPSTAILFGVGFLALCGIIRKNRIFL